MSKKRSTIFVVFAVFTAVFAFATPASAAAPKFHSATSSVNNAGALVVDFDERGLGNENVDYTVTADATAVYACLNRGGNHPGGGQQGDHQRRGVGGRVVRAEERARGCQPHRRTALDRGVQLPVRAAAGAGQRLVHQHRPDRHHQQCDHLGAWRVAHILRRRLSFAQCSEPTPSRT